MAKLFNRNTVKVSYSCTKNVKSIITSNNMTENATAELVMFALWMENVLEKVWFTVAELKVILKLKVILV